MYGYACHRKNPKLGNDLRWFGTTELFDRDRTVRVFEQRPKVPVAVDTDKKFITN